jgi:hypothetical protein
VTIASDLALSLEDHEQIENKVAAIAGADHGPLLLEAPVNPPVFDSDGF